MFLATKDTSNLESPESRERRASSFWCANSAPRDATRSARTAGVPALSKHSDGSDGCGLDTSRSGELVVMRTTVRECIADALRPWILRYMARPCLGLPEGSKSNVEPELAVDHTDRPALGSRC